ncbi:tudor domain-containing protein 5 [Trichonephila clavata]|uniref:Tudor domain-containing protein 5 n=1 Tax=Trichonephila clavata TaxID=2740835 RepID=A0A8X6LVN4_TRICU|nr:tudor domain-containing protein 5 [Trichonephila clavata]
MNHNKEFEDSKIIIRSLLIAFKDGCSLTCFKKEYQKMIGNRLPFEKFGYRSEIEYLKAIPDVVRLSYSGNDVHLMVVPDEKSIHIRKMVSKQKSTKPKLKMSSTHASFSPFGQKKYVAPPRFQSNFISKKNLSEKLKSEAVDLVSKFPTGMKLRDFLVHYRECYKREFCFKEYGFSTLDECFGTIPQLIVKVKNNESSVMLSAYLDMQHEKKYNPKGSTIDTKESVSQHQSFSSVNYQDDLCRSSLKKKNQSLLRYSVSPFLPEVVSTSMKNSHFQDYGINDSVSPFHPKVVSTSMKNSHFQDYDSISPSHPEAVSTSLKMKNSHFLGYDASREKDVLSAKREKPVLLDFDHSDHDFASKRADSFESSRISENTKHNLKKIIERNSQGIWATEFPSIYREVTNNEFDLHSLGYYDLSSFINAVPDMLVQKFIPGNKKDWLILPVQTVEKNELKSNVSTHKVEVSLTESVIISIRHILQVYPEGILIKDFLHVYSINCQEPLYFDKLGFDSIEDFLQSIANCVPLTFRTEGGCKRIFLVPTEETKTPLIPSVQINMSLPPNAASLLSEYTQQTLPEDLDLDSFFPVYVCSVINPWLMYIQLKSRDCCGAMVKLYNAMEDFYMGPESRQYQIKTEHVRSGIVCMALWPVDQHWYRAKVLSVPNQNTAKVFYVDYGTIQVIPQTMLRYIRKDFVDLPTQAIKARLAYVYPLSDKNLWSPRTKDRILQLSQNIPLMAKVESIIDEVLSVVLCDTNGDTDIFINDILLSEGFAKAEPVVPAPASAPVSQPSNPEQIFNLFLQACSAYITKMNSNPAEQAAQSLSLNPTTICTDFLTTFQSSAPQNPVPFPNNSCVVHPSLESTSTLNRCTSPISNDCGDVFDDDANIIFEEFCQKVSVVTKRYVKRITTRDSYTFHILIYESKLYVSSGDISSLIWGSKESDYLQQRLQNRESNLASIALTEDDNPQMFEQFKRFHVKGCRKMNNKFCLIAYPLSRVIHILNIFGHPSAELRSKILNEMESFNPLLPKWQELSEIEIPDKEEESYGGTDDDKLNRLCLYDLQAMKEGIRIRRLKLKSSPDLQSMNDEELPKQKFCDIWHCFKYIFDPRFYFGVIQDAWNHSLNNHISSS